MEGNVSVPEPMTANVEKNKHCQSALFSMKVLPPTRAASCQENQGPTTAAQNQDQACNQQKRSNFEESPAFSEFTCQNKVKQNKANGVKQNEVKQNAMK